ncbi:MULTISPECIES: DUF6160 family protein [Thalassolituus]|jgi:hypothetical protein|uniref:DUF6160 domain-containing protein n=1 Tax=Thalassolituus maritimus TaxID=484498 RepID=A0A1N7NH29_9GAMM|nr:MULTISPECIES: DUF6160 family protein [Thalassolituus]MAX87931.1 hypothetical protein [Oceanospirillaceae bacterium]TPD54034.1 MAG: hypothetical protein C9355_10490 [Thalassolituus maritimus]SIS97489.1 hypothetical protein SAMN05421686_1075 [Thalassolituus maritimus]|tara:strand:+ start:74 stop:712 length:639 start_codon:yes stop_codon:yes gene_type:complete
MTINKLVLSLSTLMVATSSMAEMEAIDDFDLSEISGKGGVYLSGEFAINKDGGPLWDDPNEVSGFTPGTRPIFDGAGNIVGSEECENGICGLRLAIKLNENSEGWYVLDDVSGGMSFEGLTLQTETLTTATNYDVWVDGGFEEKAVDDEVLKIGLPGTITFNDFKFKFAVANNGEFGVPLQDGTAFRQTEIFGVQLDGNITVGGNLLLFPVD